MATGVEDSHKPDFTVSVPLGKEPGKKAKGWWDIGKAWKIANGKIKIRLNSHPIGEEVYLFPCERYDKTSGG